MISVVINTYNAERHLAECLEAVKDFDEIVVCDMESTDRTVEIAQRYGCKIVTYPKGDCVSAEPARTFAIQSASSEWVLVVDSDEIITPELRKYLYERTQADDGVKGLYIARLNKIFGVYNRGWSNDYQLRFFIREGTVWPPYVHTFPTVQGRIEYIPRRRRELALIHLADDSIRTRVYKTNEYTDNEVEKKRGKHYGAFKLVFDPLFRFVKAYFFKGQIFKCVPGFINASLDAYYRFITIAKVIESRNAERDIPHRK